MSLRFRLDRFDSHMRQHTVQLEKALFDLGQDQNEAKRLSRLLNRALAVCESTMIGSPEVGEALRNESVKAIHTRVDDIAAIL